MTREERLQKFLKYVENGDYCRFKAEWESIPDRETLLNLQEDLFWKILRLIRPPYKTQPTYETLPMLGVKDW